MVMSASSGPGCLSLDPGTNCVTLGKLSVPQFSIENGDKNSTHLIELFL